MESLTLTLALSLHLGFEGDYNSIHPHLRYTTDSYIAGAYYNSESNLSTYIGKRWEYNHFGLEAGAVTGYTDLDVAPFVKGSYKQFFVTPGIEGDNIGVVFGVELPF